MSTDFNSTDLAYMFRESSENGGTFAASSSSSDCLLEVMRNWTIVSPMVVDFEPDTPSDKST